jgi:molybdenum cofactor cytidylyltransferase
MIVGVILAAGESKRMGQPKALLKIGERTFIDHIAAAMFESKLDLVYAVLGDHAEQIEPILPKNIHVIYNPNYRDGQLSSLKTAIEKIQYENCDGALVALVDHPFVPPTVMQQLVASFYSSKKRIIIPTHKAKRGHPVLYSRDVFSEILTTPTHVGANSIRAAYLEHTLEIPVDDAGILVDIDTPQDYKQHLGANSFKSAYME